MMPALALPTSVRGPREPMEANEVHEMEENQEHGAHDPSLKPISFTISVLAVMVAICTVIGHRTHTEAVLQQARASDQWNLYQAKKIRQNDTFLATDLLTALAQSNNALATKLEEGYKSHQQKWTEDLAEEQKQAQEFEADVRLAERKANRFDLGEALLEIGLVICSITLLTRQRGYWFLGMTFGVAGLVAAALGFFVH
jgi:hypothetical protein